MHGYNEKVDIWRLPKTIAALLGTNEQGVAFEANLMMDSMGSTAAVRAILDIINSRCPSLFFHFHSDFSSFLLLGSFATSVSFFLPFPFPIALARHTKTQHTRARTCTLSCVRAHINERHRR